MQRAFVATEEELQSQCRVGRPRPLPGGYIDPENMESKVTVVDDVPEQLYCRMEMKMQSASFIRGVRFPATFDRRLTWRQEQFVLPKTRKTTVQSAASLFRGRPNSAVSLRQTKTFCLFRFFSTQTGIETELSFSPNFSNSTTRVVRKIDACLPSPPTAINKQRPIFNPRLPSSTTDTCHFTNGKPPFRYYGPAGKLATKAEQDFREPRRARGHPIDVPSVVVEAAFQEGDLAYTWWWREGWCLVCFAKVGPPGASTLTLRMLCLHRKPLDDFVGQMRGEYLAPARQLRSAFDTHRLSQATAVFTVVVWEGINTSTDPIERNRQESIVGSLQATECLQEYVGINRSRPKRNSNGDCLELVLYRMMEMVRGGIEVERPGREVIGIKDFRKVTLRKG
ncbi:hypothetical protein B0H13DRAFT_1869863 [Mycena leptocephala]|nr:hypothetical protein B0H13DRAFT_1869863 [Mycena leptocephala]